MSLIVDNFWNNSSFGYRVRLEILPNPEKYKKSNYTLPSTVKSPPPPSWKNAIKPGFVSRLGNCTN